MLRFIRSVGLLAVPALLALSACRSGDEPKPAQEDRAALDPPGSPGKILKEALADLDLSAEQRSSVDALVLRTQESLAPVRQAHLSLALEVASGLRTGSPDETRIRERAEALRGAFVQVKPALAERLNQLHALLDAGQRKALVQSLRTRHEALARAHHGDGPHGLHGSMGPNGHHGKGAHHGPPRFMRRLADWIGLTPEQRESIHDRIHATFAGHAKSFHAKRGEMKAHLDALAAAFESDTFDARQIELPTPLLDRGAILDKAMGLGRTLLPLLDATQRARLADRLEEHARRHSLEPASE